MSRTPELVAEFEALGGYVVRGTKHIKLYDRPGGILLGVVPKSADERNSRSARNMRATLRRAGFGIGLRRPSLFPEATSIPEALLIQEVAIPKMEKTSVPRATRAQVTQRNRDALQPTIDQVLVAGAVDAFGARELSALLGVHYATIMSWAKGSQPPRTKRTREAYRQLVDLTTAKAEPEPEPEPEPLVVEESTPTENRVQMNLPSMDSPPLPLSPLPPLALVHIQPLGRAAPLWEQVRELEREVVQLRETVATLEEFRDLLDRIQDLKFKTESS